MKQGKMSRSRLSGLKDEQDLGTQKIRKSSNQANPDADNSKQGNAPNLPKGWEIKKIGDVCVCASSNVSQNKLADDEGDFPIYGASGLIKKVSFYHQDKPYLSIVKDGSGVGRVTKMDAYTSVIGTLQYILPKENIDLDYLYYFLMSVDFKKYIAGAAIPHIYFKDYKNEPFLWMPLPEQKRIVSILDECFAAIAKAKANAEQNLKNAKELFESYLQGVFEKKGEGWEEKTLEVLADENCTLSYGIVQPGEEFENGLPVIRPTDLTSRYIKVEALKRIDPKLADGYKRTKLIGDELLLCVRGTTGVVSIATPELKDANVTRGIVPIRFNSKIVNQQFGYYLLISNYVQKQIRAKTYGAALMQINIGDLRKIITPYPPLKEQQTIVRQLDALRAETQKLEAVYQKKIDDLEELKKSILQKAFAGELKTEKTLVI
jgi:type I restriction enzyme S subunit